MDASSGLRTYLPNSRMADYIWRCKDCGYTKKAKVKVRGINRKVMSCRASVMDDGKLFIDYISWFQWVESSRQ